MLMMQAAAASIISIIGGSFLKFDVFRYPPTSKKWCSGPDGPRRLVFKTVRAHDAHFGGFNGLRKCFKNHSVAWRFASKTHVNFGFVLQGGPGGPLEKRRSNDAGSAALVFVPCQSRGHGFGAATPGRCPISGLAAGAGPAAFRQLAES